jgi:simple sugar transport system ATP-binding protein
VRIRLGARGLTRRFGPVVANDGVDFAAAPSTIHAIVGGNGAGKSTLMRILQGVDQPDEGEVILDDQPVRLSGPADAYRLGVGLVHQEFMLAPPLTLLENLILAREPMARGLIDRRAALRAAEALAATAGVRLDWNMRVADAPVNVRQILEILRLIYRGADVLILDEPTAVLAPAQIAELLALMRKLKREGRTIVFVSHKLEEVLSVADAITVMRAGRVVANTTPSQTSAEALAEAMVGEPVEMPAIAAQPAPVGAPILSARGLVGRDAQGASRLGPADLDIFPGEIVGVVGVGGNGQDELVACVAGVAGPAAGSLVFAGADMAGAPTAAYRAAGVGYVSADRAEEGLCQSASLSDNFLAGREAAYARGGLLRRGMIADRARAALDELKVRYGRLSDAASTLSGGNQQRLVFARELDRKPRLLVASQPTRGVDIAGSAFIHTELAAFRDRGGAVLLVSESLDEALALSDRVLAIYNGRFVGELPRGAATVDAVGRLMLGRKAA